uniref:Uncharacterized protein n=1 Tax=Avena sativa TaxID=4498 RepID=A0ACD5ZH93_AVESA
MPAEGTRMAGLWEREVGRLRPKRFANSVMASKDFVQSLGIQQRLREHRGCVNTVSFNRSGSLLLSGSDDMTVMLWNWEAGTAVTRCHTGHESNVLHAQFMPFSDDRSIITSGADGEVRYLQIQEGGHVVTDRIVEMEYPVHRLAVEPGSPHTFYSCGADGSVWAFDLRGKEASELFNVASVNDDTSEVIELFAIAMDPRNPWYFAVSGSDEYVRLYDRRKSYINGDSTFGCPVEHFCPPHLIGQNKDGITGLAFSHAGEMLASYSYDNIYLFEREHGLHFNNLKVGEKILMDETVGATLAPSTEKFPVLQDFKGHQNTQTVKGVSFLGPNFDFVASGSDCGHVFVWRKKDGEVMRAMKGDRRIVNCVEQHPSEIIVASSGIDSCVKIWAPGGSEDPSMANFDEGDPDVYLFSSTSSDSDSDSSDYMDDYILTPSSGSSDGDEDDDGEDDGSTDSDEMDTEEMADGDEGEEEDECDHEDMDDVLSFDASGEIDDQ